jgi:plasmid stabilization system protein ParE
VKVTYRQAARDDLIRQFRYYLVEQNLPEIALRFKSAVKRTVKALSQRPRIAPRYILRNTELKTLRSWPVAGFEALRLYFLLEHDTIRIIRILHGKRNVRAILQADRQPQTSYNTSGDPS